MKTHRPEFTACHYLKMKCSVVASKNHPTIKGPLLKHDVYNEQHAAVSSDRFASFSQPWYDTVDKQASIAYQGMAMMSVLSVVSQTHLVAIAPRGWLKSSLNRITGITAAVKKQKQQNPAISPRHEAAGRYHR